MMSPTLVLRDGEVELGLGSAGSNRIRSAILQTIVGVVDAGDGRRRTRSRAAACTSRTGVVQAEPGVDEAAPRRLEEKGLDGSRAGPPNLFFGGGCRQSPATRTAGLGGGGDPRRGGAVGARLAHHDLPVHLRPLGYLPRLRRRVETRAPRASASTFIRSSSERGSSRRCFVSGGLDPRRDRVRVVGGELGGVGPRPGDALGPAANASRRGPGDIGLGAGSPATSSARPRRPGSRARRGGRARGTGARRRR